MKQMISHHDLEVDGNYLIGMPVIHHKIHESAMFSVTREALKDAGETDITVFRTNGKYCHAVVEFAANKSATIEVRESATLDGSGTAATVLNRNRGSDETASATVRFSASLSASGIFLDKLIVGGNAGGIASIGGAAGTRMEWILKPSTIYIFRFTAGAGATRSIVEPIWYELT